MNEDTIAIHESKNSDKVVKFLPIYLFKKKFIKMHDDSKINGCYYLRGRIVAQDIWQEIHKDIIKKSVL